MDELSMLKNRFTEEYGKATTIEAALEKAHADMSRRATGHSRRVKDASIELLKKAFNELPYFNCSKQFDKWHEEICEELKKALSIKDSVTNFEGTIGRAQKVVNMAFKYLHYVESFLNEHGEVYQYCHMTLDSYTLNWYKTDVAQGCKVKEWSKIDSYEEYMGIQEKIRDYLSKSAKYKPEVKELSDVKAFELSTVPFEAEFVVWEGEKVRKKYDELVKAIESYFCEKNSKSAGKAYDNWLIGDSFSDYVNKTFK